MTGFIKLSPAKVSKMCRLRNLGTPVEELADRFDVSHQTVSYWTNDDYHEEHKYQARERYYQRRGLWSRFKTRIGWGGGG